MTGYSFGISDRGGIMALDERVVSHYCNVLSREIRLPAMALKDDKHWAVFCLLETGAKRFGEIGDEFNYNSNTYITQCPSDPSGEKRIKRKLM